jgi:farnesyl-diphosphate farnesyltransferase
LLTAHARTFALTLRLLPWDLREPLGITYLLARASDTIADAMAIPPERRLILLEALQLALAKWKLGETSMRKPEIQEGECTTSEAELLSAMPVLITSLELHTDGPAMFQLWRRILDGQLFDLRRFFPGAPPLAREEMEHYCLLVAGGVGEAWTRLISRHYPGILDSGHEELPRMIELGIAYGNGLQLINILRDRHADRELGRSYLREEEVPSLMALADEWLDGGRQYCARLRPGRVRYATVIPLRIAIRTLKHMQRNPQRSGVRLKRSAIYGVLLEALPSLVLPWRGNPAS